MLLQRITDCVHVVESNFMSMLGMRPLVQSFQEQVGKEEARPVQCAHQGAGHHAARQHPQDGQIHHSAEKHRLPAQAQRSPSLSVTQSLNFKSSTCLVCMHSSLSSSSFTTLLMF